LSARNTLAQRLALYNDRKSHNAQRYRQADRRTDGRHNDANSDHTVYDRLIKRARRFNGHFPG